ncbi:hypothetical protein BDA99DRAFT_477022 [Phascolomyces articulosus]|uniref:Swiss Army Knife RNA repair protein HAD domain-containing protein n=1 Tax=Phascolomyces articulosus TaxID=60185 RepID=A0AAD5PHY6_9FUNG|nr:hypothetical protein BDA99DRAFT_477022 [Phascolomyces articulosus]
MESQQPQQENQLDNHVQDFDIDHSAKEWIQKQVDTEVKRVRDAGSSVLPFKIINCGIVPNFEKKVARAINRIELDTNVDVSKIEQVMVSPNTPYPHKPGFSYVNLILVTKQPIPFLAPYLYQTNLKVIQPEKEQEGRKTIPSKEVTLKNDLREFLFVNKRGIRARFTIHAYHDGILNRQFDGTPFAQQQTHRQPTELAIYDFDSTLFYSPLLSPTLWHATLVHALTTENFLGPGWWRDIRSLELGKEAEDSGWREFWNPHILQQARASIKDPNVLTVVLTGRRVHPFHQVLPRMLQAQGLQFDMVCMRPDPEIENDPSVFLSTMDFKQAFILNMLDRVPSLEHIVMWDDRLHHVKRFRTKQQQRLIKYFKVNYVHAVRPRYNPEWEKSIVNSILDGSAYTLVPMAASTIILLTPESTEKLRTLFPYTIHVNMSGELPVFFGDRVVLYYKELPRNRVPLGGIGTHVDVKIHSVSCFKSAHGFQLLVTVSQAGMNRYSIEEYPLPMYVKPSEKSSVTKLHEWDWSPTKVDLVVQGQIDYGYLYGIETLRKPGKRSHDDQ